MLNLIIFGPPGAGKGTQAKIIAERYNLIHISTGDLLRTEIREKTDLGIQAKLFMDKGNLVPDEVVIGMINNLLLKNKEVEGFIFDGFPRTIIQATRLDDLFESIGDKIDVVLSLNVPEEELIKRLLKRGLDSGRSDDANEDIIKNRIDVYNVQTKPLIDFYERQGKYREVKGNKTIDETSNQLEEIINSCKI